MLRKFWREFCLVFVFAHLPKGGTPDIGSLLKMKTAFRSNPASHKQNSNDFVEWPQFCSVPLWFESDSRVPGQLAWELRDLVWLLFSESATAESRGKLSCDLTCFSLALDPRSGPGALRSVGLFKAWHLQCAVSPRYDEGLLDKCAVQKLLAIRVSSSCFSQSVAAQVVRELFGSEQLHIQVAVDKFATVVFSSVSTGSVPAVMPFTMTDVFLALRDGQ